MHRNQQHVVFIEAQMARWSQVGTCNKIAKDMFDESRQVHTKFGTTHVCMSGNPTHPPILFFHGIATCSLMFGKPHHNGLDNVVPVRVHCGSALWRGVDLNAFVVHVFMVALPSLIIINDNNVFMCTTTGDWLFPELSKHCCCIAADTIGDMGRSCPKDNNPDDGPSTEQETADWIVQALEQLRPQQQHQQQQPVNVIGHSMGTTLGACLVRFYPKKVHRMVLMAPVFLLAPVRKLWLAQAISFGMLSAMIPQQDGKMAKHLQTWFFGPNHVYSHHPANAMPKIGHAQSVHMRDPFIRDSFKEMMLLSVT